MYSNCPFYCIARAAVAALELSTHKKAVLSQLEPRDVAVNFYTSINLKLISREVIFEVL